MNILVAGDFVANNRLANQIEKGNYGCLDEIKPIVRSVDYALLNFESPIVMHEALPIEKTGPNLRCTERAMECVAKAGFRCVTLANNHFRDFGQVGVEDTIASCRKYGVDYVGGGTNAKDAGRVLYKKINGHTLAVVNCCEREFSIADENQGGANPLNPIKHYYDIKEARQNAEYVIVVVHGGIEMFQYPTIEMKRIYRFFVDSGADAVVNHHQHCYSGYEEYHGKPIFYGLGNFCFDKLNSSTNEIWEKGYFVILSFDEKISYAIYPYQQCNSESVSVNLLINRDLFDKSVSEINKIIEDDVLLKKQFDIMAEKTRGSYIVELLNYENRYLKSLYRRKLFPSFLSRRMLVRLLGNLRCASNLIRLEDAIEMKLIKSGK